MVDENLLYVSNLVGCSYLIELLDPQLLFFADIFKNKFTIPCFKHKRV